MQRYSDGKSTIEAAEIVSVGFGNECFVLQFHNVDTQTITTSESAVDPSVGDMFCMDVATDKKFILPKAIFMHAYKVVK